MQLIFSIEFFVELSVAKALRLGKKYHYIIQFMNRKSYIFLLALFNNIINIFMLIR